MKLISFEEALAIVLDSHKSFGHEKIPLSAGIGRVLGESWFTDRDLPPYDRVTMDGIAINYDGAVQNKKLQIEGIVAAGDAHTELQDPNNCLEIMTGAVLPKGADTIVRYEDIDVEDSYVTINIDLIKNKNIHWRGEDSKKGTLAVATKTLLSAAEIGIGAAIGKREISVFRNPSTIIISTGDELVDIDQIPEPHQIRRGNVYRMEATLKQLGVEVDTDHLQDDKQLISDRMSQHLQQYDLIILSGGVSKGKFDYLPTVLKECGVKEHFHKIAQRPGKPFWFGTHPDGATIFALPGNPVSSFMCLHIYVIDWIRKCLQLKPLVRPHAILTKSIYFKPDLTYFHEVKIGYNEHGQILATPQKGHGSGDLTNLTFADAFIKLPRGKDHFKEGEVYPIYFYR